MELMTVPVDQIKTTRVLSNGAHRLREVKDLEGLKSSIQLHGLLVPVIVEEDMELVDGMHRLQAFRELGIKEIPCVLQSKLDDLTARTLELETTLQRKDMSWQERTFALAELDKIRRAADPTWGQTQTATIGKTTQSRVSEAIQLQAAIKLFPELAKAKSVNQAQSWLKHKASQIVRVVEVRNAPELYHSIEERIFLGDSREVVKILPSESVSLVLTDPPFGIDYDERKGDTSGSMNSYEDSEASYLTLLDMAPEIYRVCKPNAFFVWFLGMSWYERAKDKFRSAGFVVDELPVIWDRSDGRTWTARPDRYFGRAYDAALHCLKGDPQIIQRGKPNIIRVPPVESRDRDLLVERPVELYQELIRRLTVEGETVLDLFVGSGSCPAAAASLRRNYIGSEMDPERRAVAIKKIQAWTPKA